MRLERKLFCCLSGWTITLPRKIRCVWSTFSSTTSSSAHLGLSVSILLQRGVQLTSTQRSICRTTSTATSTGLSLASGLSEKPSAMLG